MNVHESFSAFLSSQTLPLYLNIRVVPNAKKTEIGERMDDGTWKFRLSAPAVEGKANAELKKFFQKTLKYKVEIINGEKGREKLLKIF